jgi:hypothetical protein
MNVSNDVYLWLHGKLSVKAARVCALLAVLGAVLTSRTADAVATLEHAPYGTTQDGHHSRSPTPPLVTNARGTLAEAIPFRKQPARIIRYLMGLPILRSGVIAILSARCHLLAARPTASFGPAFKWARLLDFDAPTGATQLGDFRAPGIRNRDVENPINGHFLGC